MASSLHDCAAILKIRARLDTGIPSDMLAPNGVGACRPAEGGVRPDES
jgi:hypothetical protein